jgi:hypothetical protein
VPPQCVHRLGKRQCRVLLPPRLILEIDIRELLSVVVAHDETGVESFDGPGRREPARYVLNDVLGLILPLHSANLAFERRLIDLRFRTLKPTLMQEA